METLLLLRFNLHLDGMTALSCKKSTKTQAKSKK
jgi:hypothetical protein